MVEFFGGFAVSVSFMSIVYAIVSDVIVAMEGR